MLPSRIFHGFLAFALAAGLPAIASGAEVVAWDFTQGLHGWQGNSYVKDLAITAEGLAFTSIGIDPWIEGPAVDLRGGEMTRVRVRMKSYADPAGELFYGRTFQAGRSVQFTIVNDGQWHEYPLLIAEPLGSDTRFRLDPGTGAGRIVVGSIQVETLAVVQAPAWEKPRRPDSSRYTPALVASGELALERYHGLGQFVVKVDGQDMAAGYHAERIGMILDGEPQWLSLKDIDAISTAEPGKMVRSRATVIDSGSATWQITREFRTGAGAGQIDVQTEFVVDRDRDVIHLPWLTLFPGLGTFGERKTQGLFAGLEYLDDEPGSSEADIATREHIRRAPDPIKITFPLMAVAHGGRYLAVVWEPSDLAAAVFDSPDRIYNCGAHVMALSAPAVGDRRFENAIVAHTPIQLKANQPLTVRATIIGGSGATVIPAVQKYVEMRGLPAIPCVEGVPPSNRGQDARDTSFDAAVTLLSHGWLDSAINEGGLFRHAVWGESFKAGPAGDAIMYMDWLANHARDADLVKRLDDARDLAVTKMPRGQPYVSMVSHTRTPSAPFVFGGLYPYVERRRADAESLLAHFDEQGIKLYRPGDVDYGRTHFAEHANGYAAPDVVHILEGAILSADPDLISRGLALLDKQTSLYANSVPRGAQTWEVPLHTPDILASAYLVKAYTLGYIISKKPEHLEQARYWAWTGVPFVYLANPTEGDVGHYATIAVLGATNWQAPSWFGRPVQWCGLVYGSALHLLSQYDREGPWSIIARGITAAGLQMTWPTSDEKRQGLLPDFFHLRAQLSDGPAINPGTVQAHVPELFDKGSLYDVRRLEKTGCFVHAPCAIRDLKEAEGSVAFTVDGWGNKIFYVLLSGAERAPAATIRPAGPASGRGNRNVVDFDAQQRLAVITVRGPAEIQVRF